MNSFPGGSAEAGGALGPADREASIAVLRGTTGPGQGTRHPDRRRRHRRRRRRPGRRHPRAERGHRRGQRLGRGDVVAVLEAHPRRPPLPGNARLRPGQGGAAGTRAAFSPYWRRTWPGRSRSCTRSTKPFLERPYVGAGIALYDAMSISGGHSRGVPFHKHLSRRGTLRAAPSLKDDAFVGSIRYYDGQVDDAKYVRQPGAHRGATTAPTRSTRCPSWTSCAKANAWSAPRWSTTRTAPASTSGPSRSSTPPGSGPTKPRPW